MINNRYSIKRKIGEGRSKVFLCSDNEFPGNEIALKVFVPDAALEELIKFEDEYFTLRKLNHPNIIKVNELGTIVRKGNSDEELNTGSGFISFEYFDGVELDTYEELNDEEALISIIQQISSVLYYLHQSNFIYYDLKPGNILVKKIDDKPFIKLIDFGFVHNIAKSDIYTAKGTAEYIAPEILKKEQHNHSVDLYSFGMLLYKLIYGQLPFSTENELEIYKAHIEKEFEFPQTEYSVKIIDVVKKLLQKDPNNRYSNSLQILRDLDLFLDKKITKDFIPARSFADRKDSINTLNKYIKDNTSNEVFSVRGFGGSGKSALLEEVYSNHPNSVLISGIKSKNGINFINYLVKKIVFTDFIYSNIKNEIVEKVEKLLTDSRIDYKEELKSLFTNLSLKNNFILLLDDYNNYDEFTLDILNNLIPILQVNKVKVILSENSDFDHKADDLFNLKVIGLNPYTEAQLIEYLDISFYPYFPKVNLKKTITLYADLLPGSVDSFIKDLILLEIIEFHHENPVIKFGEKVASTLNGSQNDIYQLRLDLLTDNELKTAEVIASLNIGIDSKDLSEILDFEKNHINKILKSLAEKNIIHSMFNQSETTFNFRWFKKIRL